MNNKNMLDVHTLNLQDAINVITKNIKTSYDLNVSVLYVNHGFNKGTKIKNWCLNEAIKINEVIKVDNGDNEGITKIYIKLKIK